MNSPLPARYSEHDAYDVLSRSMEFFRNLFDKKRRSRVVFWDLVERAENHLRHLDTSNQAQWGLANAARQLDLHTGTVTFRTAADAELTAQAQVVGTLSHGRPVWRWAWDSNSVPTALTRSALAAQAYGSSHEMTPLTTASFSASLSEAWGLVAVTCLLADAQGAYCEETEQGLVFFVFSREALADGRTAMQASLAVSEPGGSA